MSPDIRAGVTWLIAPVLLAGLVHVAVLKAGVLQALSVPLDAGARWRGKPIFGSNKTWRGPIVMTLGTAGATALQRVLLRPPPTYRLERAPMKGATIGLTYTLAELPNSFVKRRRGIAPGELSHHLGGVQYVVDQLDSVAGCLIAARVVYRAPPKDLVAAFAVGAGVHVGVDLLMRLLGLKRA